MGLLILSLLLIQALSSFVVFCVGGCLFCVGGHFVWDHVQTTRRALIARQIELGAYKETEDQKLEPVVAENQQPLSDEELDRWLTGMQAVRQ